MKTNRRNFIKTSAIAAASIVIPSTTIIGTNNMSNLIKSKSVTKMKLSWTPYDLQLKHVFTISGFSRKTTPVVLTKIEYDGLVGYGEASLPPYLGETQASVIEFLRKVNLSSFSDPTHLEDILYYVDHITENNTAVKASVDIAMHDLVGKILGQPWFKIWGFDIDPN